CEGHRTRSKQTCASLSNIAAEWRGSLSECMRRLAKLFEFSCQHRDTQIRLGAREVRLKRLELVSGFRQPLELCSLLGRHWLVGGHRFQFLDRPVGGKLRSIGSLKRFLGPTRETIFGSIIGVMKGPTFGARSATWSPKAEAVRLAVYDGTDWAGTSQNLSTVRTIAAPITRAGQANRNQI